MPTQDENVATLMERTKCLPQMEADIRHVLLAVQRIDDQSATDRREHQRCQSSELPAIRAELNRLANFRRIAAWGGSILLGLLLVLTAEVIKRGIALALPTQMGR